MQLEELFDMYFVKEKENTPYQSENEYQLDCMRFLDMLLTIACSLKYIDTNEEQQLEVENIHLRGISITANEVLDALRANCLENDTDLPLEFIREILNQAYVQIGTRLKNTTISIPLIEIKDKLLLSELEYFLLLLAYANFVDAKYELLYAYLQGDIRMKLPSLRLAVSLYDLWRETDKQEAGRIAGGKGVLFDILLETREIYDNVMLTQAYTLCQTVYHRLMSDSSLPVSLKEGSLLTGNELNAICIRREEQCRITNLVKVMETQENGECQVLNIYGEKGNGKRFSIEYALKESGRRGILVNVAELIQCEAMREHLRILYQMSVLWNDVICFYFPSYSKQEEEKEEITSFKIRQLLELCREYFPFFIWISEEKAEYLLEQELRYMGLKLETLSIKERYLFWSEMVKAYPVSKHVDYRLISNQHLLSMKGIKDALWNAELHRKSEGRDEITALDIKHAVKQQSVSQLGQCAHLIHTAYTWEDLVLPEEPKRQLEMICNYVRYKDVVGEEWGFYEKTAYGRGVCALFSGAPGTGKTMAVQVIANELGLNLYRIDLSQLISKYVGETEKNISKVFEKARGINALLFFDEADSMFAKRLDVHDSMDRSANAQTAHLLQEIEDYDGITILATNLAMNIDDAFKRRIKFMVKFAFPEKEVRLQLWKSILPDKTPCEEEIDLEFFAEKFELSGSSIKEILTLAAFEAAAAQRRLTNKDVIEAIKRNYSKYGKTLTNEEFGYLL